MNQSQWIIFIILVLSTSVPRLLPMVMKEDTLYSTRLQRFNDIMPALLSGLLVMIALPTSFFSDIISPELMGLGFMILLHCLFRKNMLTMMGGTLLVVILKTWW
ncbi:MAG: AzlD domain-containing protein [Erysipelothrix sp.]|jgi:branched-subunit amino acid transport protein AzlD|nr:AzlD domain-containing protein [Erysipelothrix sp.]